ncbi:MAG TPA: hypothetical protein VI585_12745 [Candidatus Binatia bacterium]
MKRFLTVLIASMFLASAGYAAEEKAKGEEQKMDAKDKGKGDTKKMTAKDTAKGESETKGEGKVTKGEGKKTDTK